MVDYLNHLGRAHILANWHHNELFQKVFVLDSLLLPNVLSDIVLAALSGWIGALVAGQVVLLLILVLTVVGAFALNTAATKQLSTWPPSSPYSSITSSSSGAFSITCSELPYALGMRRVAAA